ncbi:MAG: hypothetical protein WC184_13065 [Acidimicrobiia bacterium]
MSPTTLKPATPSFVRRGLTLVEIILGLVVGALLVFAAFVSFQNVFTKTREQAELAALKSVAREAQALLAISGADRWDTQAGLDAVLGALEDWPPTQAASVVGVFADESGVVVTEADAWPSVAEVTFSRSPNTLLMVVSLDDGACVVTTPPHSGTIQGGCVTDLEAIGENTPAEAVTNQQIPGINNTANQPEQPTTTEPEPSTSTTTAPPTTTTTPPTTTTTEQPPTSQIFVGSEPTNFTVPKNIYNINFSVQGGAGASGGAPYIWGGRGAVITGTLPVTPGETLLVVPATAGAGTTPGVGAANGGIGSVVTTSRWGGAGGGASGIARNGGWLVVAGGGGGAGDGGGRGGYGDMSGPGGNGGENAPYSYLGAGTVGLSNLLSDGRAAQYGYGTGGGGGGWSGGLAGGSIFGTSEYDYLGMGGGGGGGNLVPPGGTASVASTYSDGKIVLSW